jgi:pimeloyl-ACP methyl ester carboxylesterase
MTPKKRIQAMKSLGPKDKPEPLAPEVSDVWGKQWLESDPVARKKGSRYVRFPSGPSQDIEDLKQGKTYYHPELIRVPTLIIRGEWDHYPNNEEGGRLLSLLENDSCKKYVVIGKGTHVMHLENSRLQLYDEVNLFLKV